MNNTKVKSLLFLKDSESKFDSNTVMFTNLFSRVDVVEGRENALEMFDSKSYDIVLSDLSEKPEELAFLKQLQDKKKQQIIFALMSPKDSDKLYGVADLGIHAFELLPEQFDLALQEIEKFDPSQV